MYPTLPEVVCGFRGESRTFALDLRTLPTYNNTRQVALGYDPARST